MDQDDPALTRREAAQPSHQQDSLSQSQLLPSEGHAGLPLSGRIRATKPRLLLMGQRRSGKSSIAKVVFQKMSPSETLYLETTTRIQKEPVHSFLDLQVWDFPGHLDYLDPATFDSSTMFSDVGALVWVIDAQDEYYDAIVRLNSTILHLQSRYPHLNVEVFVHKVDGLSDDYKKDTFDDIQQRVQDELSDAGYDNAPVYFYQTSIYDYSIFEAFSKVLQKLLPTLPAMEALLDALCRNCRIHKAYLFDVLTKIYIATDTSPSPNTLDYEVCSEYIDLVLDITEIYGWSRPPITETLLLPSAEVSNEDKSASAQAKSAARLEETGMERAESMVTMAPKKDGQPQRWYYLKEVSTYLALICIMGEDSPQDRKALVDYNVGVFEDALNQVV